MYMFKNAIINLNDPNESVYIYNFQHSTVYIQTFYKCNALLPYIIYLICKFIHPFILIFSPENRELYTVLIKFYIK